MQKLFFTLLFYAAIGPVWGQADVKKLINDGIELNDKGDYEGALAKYDEALKIDPADCKALYEKSYTLMVIKKYDESEVLAKKILNECHEPELRRLTYVTYGTILDYKGQSKEALKVYDDGIKEFPDKYLLYYNKGVTLSDLGESEKSLESFMQSVKLNPFHPSSHNALATMMYEKNRIPAILSYFTFLLLEPEGKRAVQDLDFMNRLIMKGINEKDDKNVTISVDVSSLDKKNKPKEDDFSSAELIFTLVAANKSLPDSLGAKTDADRLSYKLQMLTDFFNERFSKEKGFYKTFYVPFFIQMKKDDWMTTACNIVLTSSNKPEIKVWLALNKEKVANFYKWLDQYKWIK